MYLSPVLQHYFKIDIYVKFLFQTVDSITDKINKQMK